MRRDPGQVVAAFIGWVEEVLAARDRERLTDDELDRQAAKALRRARGSYSLCATVFRTLSVLHRERGLALDGATAATHHDLALLFLHSRYAERPLALLREADTLAGGRHRPGIRPRRGDQRPFTEYLSGKRTLVAQRGGVPGDDVLRDARMLSEALRDPYLKADVDAFLRSLGAEPPKRPAPSPKAPSASRTASALSSGPTAAGAAPPAPRPRVPGPSAEPSPADRDEDAAEETWREGMVALARIARGGSPDAPEAASLLREFGTRALREADEQEGLYHRTDDLHALERAMRSTSRASLCAVLAGDTMGALGHGMNVGRLHAVRFARLGVWDDIVHAVGSMRTVIAQLPPDDPVEVGCRIQLAVTLAAAQEHMTAVYGTHGGTENADAAVAELREARRLAERGIVPPGDDDLPATVLVHLGHALMSRAVVQVAADAAERDLAEGLELLDRAAVLLGDGGDDPDRPLVPGRGAPGRAEVVTLLRLYRTQGRLLRAVADGDVTGAEEVIATVRERIRTGGDPLTRPQWQTLLGNAQVFAAASAGRNAVDPSVPAVLREAARGLDGHQGPQPALRAARLAASVALGQGRWSEAAELLTGALERIHDLHGHGIPGSARRAWLRQGRDLTGDLVSCLVALGRERDAVVAFERHRAVLLSEVLGERVDTAGLDEAAPDLARAHRAATRELRRFEAGADAHRPHHPERRRRLLGERERVAERVRAVRGFERFGQAPRYEDLTAGGEQGPTVLLNVGSLSGQALILQDGDVSAVALPDMRRDRLEGATGALHRALAAAEKARADRDGSAYLRHQRAVGSVLEQLWDAVAAPVWERIGAGETAGEAPRRVWWVPSGPLWFLPLHAATAAGGPSLTDLAVSSYAPTVRMLRLGRRRAPGRLRRPLVVSVPHAPGAAPLPGAAAEADLLRDLVPGTVVLEGPEATRDAVLDALGRHPCLHFAGHGINTPDGTLLLLHDCLERPFTTQDVLDRDLPGGDLAYLSACEAAQTSVLLPDEATHFGAALSVAGYRHVIGTLWRVDDEVALGAAENFYGRLARATVFDPALALHETVRALRTAYPSMPGLWAAHVHIGP
ncbi:MULTISPECIES: CHAT domain-containing protein [unclassified Streptomyces]|uniref:CHAT domain-containing protein n=1 Tax=unclassified Streptomyces TaxID=2593676 RepID=UPI0036B81737